MLALSSRSNEGNSFIRLHLIRFHGVLAPNAKLRSQIVPAPAQRAAETSSEGAHAQGAPPRMSWARLLKRVFDIDIEHCPNCGGAMKIIAAIEDPPVIDKILGHLGLPTRDPWDTAPWDDVGRGQPDRRHSFCVHRQPSVFASGLSTGKPPLLN